MSAETEQQMDTVIGEASAETPTDVPSAQPQEQAKVAPAQFDELSDSANTGTNDEVDLSVILDVPVTLALEVGRTKMTIRDLLRLNQGSVVELERPAEEPMDLLVNGTLVATAEIVVVDDNFGIRLIDVVSPSERIRNLRNGAASQ